MNDELYAITVDNYALPGFASGHICYVGELDEIRGFIDGISERHDALREDLSEAFAAFEAGDREVKHYVAYSEMKFLLPVDLLGCQVQREGQMKWSCMNIWDCPYEYEAEQTEIRHIWIAYEDHGEKRYARYGKMSFTKLMNCDEITGQPVPVSEFLPFWGFPNLIKIEEDRAYTSLYVPERGFKNEKECLEDLAHMQFEPERDLQCFVFGIVGDG